MLVLAPDQSSTAVAYASGRFTDPKRRSYINGIGHEFLFGPDKTRRWEELYVIRGGCCETCGEFRTRGQVDMDHRGRTPRTRCDCLGTKLADGSYCTGISLKCTLDPRKGGSPNSCHARRHNREIKSGKVAA